MRVSAPSGHSIGWAVFGMAVGGTLTFIVGSARPAGRGRRVPPRADVAGELVIAFHHVERQAIALLGVGNAKLARLVALLVVEPVALVAPQARALGDDLGRPGLGVVAAAAPAVFEHELRRRPG